MLDADPPPGVRSALALTILNAVLPGTAFLAAGRRRLGAVVLGVFLLLLLGGAWLATAGQRFAARLGVDPTMLLWIAGAVVVLGLLWALVVVAGHRSVMPWRASRGQRLLGAGVVLLVLLAGVLPTVLLGRAALEHRDLIAGVFAEDRESATVVDTPDPFGAKERVNVLLLGSDAGRGREGTRTDSVIVASIATDTGDTTLISLPRNLQHLPFPPDTPLAEVYPEGFTAGSESESLLNAVYRNGPAAHPDILGPTSDPGADFLKLGVGEALGLTIDYFVLVNLEGFSRFVDALGGITVNVNYYVPIGGDDSAGILPSDYIAPGPDRKLDGRLALNFARGRYGLTDYDRMARQRCTITAIIDAADPVTVLRQYQDLASATEDIVETDIPQAALDDFVDLGFLVKDADVRSLIFDPDLIDPAHPNYHRMRQLVQDALDPPSRSDASPSSSQSSSPSSETAESAGDEPAEPSERADGPADDAGDACAYDEHQAEEARAEGEPPTREG